MTIIIDRHCGLKLISYPTISNIWVSNFQRKFNLFFCVKSCPHSIGEPIIHLCFQKSQVWDNHTGVVTIRKHLTSFKVSSEIIELPDRLLKL